MTDLVPLHGGIVSLGEGTPLSDPWLRWLGNYSPETQSAYRRDLTQWFDWMQAQDRTPLNATVGDVIGYIGHLRALGRKPATMARKVSCISSYFTWAREEGITDANPMPSSRRRPKAQRKITLGLSLNLAYAVLDEAETRGARTRAFITCLVYSGCRVSELCGLDIPDLREEAGHRVLRVVGKGDKERDVPAPAPILVALTDYWDGRDEGPAFRTRTGQRMGRREGHRTVAAIGDAVGVKLYPHLFRHTAATLALEAGAPVDRVQRWLGHASLDTTMLYVQARQNLELSPAHDLSRYLAERRPSRT
jgi:integrase/recombinase XerD